MSDIFHLVIGTAGHIDHGKSSLVKAITGKDPDRLKEEKERGLTIDLGFAPLPLPDGKLIGIIDVPGHEKFIKNMVAGATSIDFVILVIAADDGVMPQTREHLEIMQLLNIQRGMVVLTKIDIVDEDLRELALEEIQEFVQGTFLQQAPVVAVSSSTGEGIEQFKNLLLQKLLAIAPHAPQGIFRMPIQRVFSSRGYGTIITGVPVSGHVAIGDIIEILPGKHPGRVRKIQAYGKNIECAQAGHSCALNIKDINYKTIARGQVAATPGYLRTAHFINAKFSYLSSVARPLKHLTPIRFHTGTLEEMGKIAVLGQSTFEPGSGGYVQVRLQNSVPVVPGDYFVVRLSSPMVTIGGGVIISTGEKKMKRFRNKSLDVLQQREHALQKLETHVEFELQDAGVRFTTQKELQKMVTASEQELQQVLDNLLLQKRLVKIEGSLPRFIHSLAVENIIPSILQTLRKFFHDNPFAIYADKLKMQSKLRLDNQVWNLLLQQMESRGVVATHGDALSIPGREITFTDEQQQLLVKIEQCFQDNLFSPPVVDDLPAIVERPSQEIKPFLQYLKESGRLVETAKKIFFHRTAIQHAETIIRDTIHDKGQLVSAEFRDMVNSTRKYVIPLLEYFDHLGVTIRKDNIRILKN